MYKKKPKISIITVTYNSESHLEETILSVITQSYENKEYIIIDGGSKDETLNIVNKYQSHIDYFISEPDNGISDAFNKGIAAATGDIIGILNSDDFMMPDVLRKIAEEYDSEIDVYRGYCIVWSEKMNKKRKVYPNNRFNVPPFGAIICHESAFICKHTYDKIGKYKTSFKYAMDLDFFIRLYRANIKTKVLDVCVITFRTGGVSSSSALEVQNERKKLIIENGGSQFDVFIYLTYHKIKHWIKAIILYFLEW